MLILLMACVVSINVNGLNDPRRSDSILHHLYSLYGPALPFIPLVKIIERVSLFLFLKD